MTAIIKKYRIVFPIISAFLAAVITLAACTDEIIYKTTEIPDADVEIRGEVIYRPLVPVEIKTRAEAPDGNSFTGIKSLYVLFFNSDGEIINDYSGEVSFSSAPAEGSTHEHVTFKKRIRSGRYYVYAVANISESQKNGLAAVTTIDQLRNFKLDWDDEIGKDIEMFGVFSQDVSASSPDNDGFEADNLLAITPDNNRLHSWVRRAASKVTVDFDGTSLKDGVTVYIKKASLKDLASGALLGAESRAVGTTGTEETAEADGSKITCVQSNYSISYGNSDDHNNWPTVTKEKAFSPADVWGSPADAKFHDDNARALPCYENMQGDGPSKHQDSDNDGIIDSKDKDGVDNGTYLEVEGYYVADRAEYKSQGKIIYRFMLGKDADNNFDLIRNHHYKITMRFKDYGNDVDWHIEYADRFINATYPDSVNYQGKFFVPSKDYVNYLPNAGHDFDDKNAITVTSFEKDNLGKRWIDPEISYTYYLYNEKTGGWDIDKKTAPWLTLDAVEDCEEEKEGSDPKKVYKFKAAMTDPYPVKINSLFPSGSIGSKSDPYNLSNKEGKSTIENTANCYMVGASGWYCIPLVYGNAITDEKTNKGAYDSPHIVNHLKAQITKPSIKDNVDLSNVSVKLIWQDAEDLVSPTEIYYDAGLFGGIGGIKFHISSIKEGNAVIALIDNTAKEDDGVDLERPTYGQGGSTKAIWSWHIWATRFGFGNFEKDIRIRNHNDQEFDVMPVNLGWCSGDKEIIYYRRRKCDIKFKVGEHELVRTIVQYPHFVLPRGDHPYYQWGRKDPFVGTNLAYGNKPRWSYDYVDNKPISYLAGADYNPPRLYQEPKEFADNIGRKNTVDCLDVLVKNPDKWHNAPRQPKVPGDNEQGFYSTNKSYDDLWLINGNKTVYDPCPAGYQVGSSNIFTGFTAEGINMESAKSWNDVLESNMQQDYYTESPINSQVIAFYTDTRKIQSIPFPITGYRDYDSKAEVVEYYVKGEYNGQCYVWLNAASSETKSFHLKFWRSDLGTGEGQTTDWESRKGYVAMTEDFYNTDGFGVRPSAIKP